MATDLRILRWTLLAGNGQIRLSCGLSADWLQTGCRLMAEDPHSLSIVLGATTSLHIRSRMPAGTGRPRGASRPCGIPVRPDGAARCGTDPVGRHRLVRPSRLTTP